jgi:hypothetical protein
VIAALRNFSRARIGAERLYLLALLLRDKRLIFSLFSAQIDHCSETLLRDCFNFLVCFWLVTNR